MRNKHSLRSQQKYAKSVFFRRCSRCQQAQRDFPARATKPTQLQIVSSMYAYLMTSWEELPDENKRALGFDFVVGSEGEEKALNHLARLFMDYADLSFSRALMARRRRLGIDE
ncbi:hypothetical protein CFII64_03637 [Pseudomonas sp. CFII64]|jgi:hypothetical protein|nr:hypothetical protein [Pseudomonas sp. CFII64]EPJ88881.1 hypothetical protein CFII64_03637 [Pseudomonas sp. CFII64]